MEMIEHRRTNNLRLKTAMCKAIGLGHAQTLAQMHQQIKSATKQRSCSNMHNNAQSENSDESC